MNDPSARPAMRRLAAVALLAGAALLGGACRRAAAPAAPARFVFSMQTEPTTLNFVTATDAASMLVERLLSDFLVDHDRSLKIVPRLAESWDWSADHRTLTFHLRAGVRFHDGRPLTSDDVLFTYERLIDPKSKAVGRLDSFLPVESVTAPDARTVVVRYREPYAPALRTWEIPILPAHRYRGVDFETAPENRAPIGAGPYRFEAWDSGSRIVLRRNDDYWGERPAIDEFVFRFQPSLDTSLLSLLAGETDYTKITATAWGARRQDPAFVSRYKVLTFTPLFFYYIAWRGDGSNPYFADPLVRRALGSALDREGYIRSVLQGLGSPVRDPLSLLLPGMPAVPATPPIPGKSGPAADAVAPAVPKADAGAPAGPSADAGPAGAAGASATLFDPDRAAQLLDEAGWRLDRRTGLRARGGRPFRFTLLVFAGGEDHVQFAQVAQDTLRRIGVEMRVEKLDWPALWSRLKSGQFEAALSGTSPSPDPDSLYGMLHSSQIGGGQNYAAYRDAEVDRWLEEGRRELDPARRDAVYRRIAARLDEAQPYTTLFSPSVVGVLNSHFEGAEPSPQGILGHVPGALAIRPASGGR
jgi:peptide/nickel transport system substrate-binding protein